MSTESKVQQTEKFNRIMEEILIQLELSGMGNIRYNYSGRCMFGSTCVGFVTDSKQFNIGLQVGILLEDFKEELDDNERFIFICKLKNVRTDSMGLDTIIYWEDFNVPDPDDHTGDEE